MVDAPAPAKPPGQRKVVRRIFMVLLWLLLAGFFVQVLLVGLGLFYDGKYLGTHAGLGWPLGHLAALVMILGFFARLGRNGLILNIVNFVLTLALPFLATYRSSLGTNGYIGTLHPLVAVSAIVITLLLALRLQKLLAAPAGTMNVGAGPAPPPARPLMTKPAPPETPRVQAGRPVAPRPPGAL